MSQGHMDGGHLNLEQLQRAVFDAVRQPLTEDEYARANARWPVDESDCGRNRKTQ